MCTLQALSMPMTTYHFGQDEEPGRMQCDIMDGNEFVSSVCWSRRGDLLLAANSLGTIKILSFE